MDSTTTTLLMGLFSVADVWLVFIITIFVIEIPAINALKSEDPDQMPNSAASDLHHLPVAILEVSQPKWVY